MTTSEDGEEVEVREAKDCWGENTTSSTATADFATSPRPQISQREPAKPKLLPGTCYKSSVYAAGTCFNNENTSENITRCTNVNVNWLLIVRIQTKDYYYVRHPRKYEEATEMLIYYYLMRVSD